MNQSFNKSSPLFNNQFPTNQKAAAEAHWLLVSSFSRAHLKDAAEHGHLFTNFIPCVGSALRVERASDQSDDTWQLCANLSPTGFDASIFCFLPLSTKSSRFKFHVNCPFMLTEDRSRIFERTRDDRSSDSTRKHEWNEQLIAPIVDNVLTLFGHAAGHLRVGSAPRAVEWLFPVPSLLGAAASGYFRRVELEFYRRICSLGSNERAFPAASGASRTEFHAFKDCVFVDFEFNDLRLQRMAVQFVTQVYNKNVSIVFVLVSY
jgi:hypothetical protein